MLAGIAPGSSPKALPAASRWTLAQAEFAEAVGEPEGAVMLGERRGGDGEEFQLPLTHAGLMEVQPVEGAVDGERGGQAGDAQEGQGLLGQGGFGARSGVEFAGAHSTDSSSCSSSRAGSAKIVHGRVLHRDEEQAAGRSGLAGGGAGAGREDMQDVGRIGAACGGVDEGSNQIADHVVEEAGAGDAVEYQAVLDEEGRGVDAPGRRLLRGGRRSLPRPGSETRGTRIGSCAFETWGSRIRGEAERSGRGRLRRSW